MTLLTRLERGEWRIPRVPEQVNGAIDLFAFVAEGRVDGALAVPPAGTGVCLDRRELL